MPTIISYIKDLDDPRTGNACRHRFCDIMTISLLCALCGGETAVDMADFAVAKEDFLREFLLQGFNFFLRLCFDVRLRYVLGQQIQPIQFQRVAE